MAKEKKEDEKTMSSSSSSTSTNEGKSKAEKTDQTTNAENIPKKNYKYKPREKTNSQFGKANPVRDMLLFLGFMAFMFFISYLYKDVGRNKDDPDHGKPSLASLKKVQKRLMEAVVKRNDEKNKHKVPRPVDLPCNVYIFKSSIAGPSGLGLYAGQNFTAGQEIMKLDSLAQWIDASTSTTYGESTSSGDHIWVPPYALMLKHHPTLVNVQTNGGKSLWTARSSDTQQTDMESISLIAMKDIAVGEEFFLSIEDHLVKVLPALFEIPTLEQYQDTDEVIKIERLSYKLTSRVSTKNINKQRLKDIGQGLRMLQQTVSRYRPVVANLLPITTENLLAYNKNYTTTALQTLSNRTEQTLHEDASCISDLQPSGVISRSITKGERITALPLFFQQTSPEQGSDESAKTCHSDGECPADGSSSTATSSCLYLPNILRDDIFICPLLNSDIEFVATTESSIGVGDNDDDDDDSNSNKTDPNDSNTNYNAILQWSEWNEAVNIIQKKHLDVSLDKYSLSLTWDVIATKDIAQGEKIVVALPVQEGTGQWIVPRRLIPEKWTSSKVEA